jgi:hypothetical protein
MRSLLSSYRAKKLLMQISSFGTVTYDSSPLLPRSDWLS